MALPLTAAGELLEADHVHVETWSERHDITATEHEVWPRCAEGPAKPVEGDAQASPPGREVDVGPQQVDQAICSRRSPVRDQHHDQAGRR